MRTPLAALFTASCFGTVSRPTCSEHRAAIADDEPTALGTAAELLAATSGPRVEAATLEDGGAVTATVEVARGDGPAEWVDREPDSIETRTWGFGHSVLTIAVYCDDTLEIPAAGALATDDGAFDVVVDGALTTGGTLQSDGPGFDASVPFAGSGYPLPDEPELDTFHDQRAFLQVVYRADGTTGGQAGWEGERTHADGTVEGRAHPQLEW